HSFPTRRSSDLDLRRRAAGPPQSEAGRGAWRRLSAGLFRRIDHAASARPDCCEQLKEMPTTYLKRLYFDALVYTHHQMHYVVEEYGADHILMGTDYPADMGETDPIGFIEGAERLDNSARRAILGDNAARLL